MARYGLYHDIGKPYCRTVDSEGKVHFLGHAQKSWEIYKELFPEDFIVQDLIQHDMLIHCGSAEEITELFHQNPRLVINLLVSALSEVHSNCLMFGGRDSTSFKIKLKKVDQRCKLISKLIYSGK
jgi:hypothetical protein